MRPADHVRSLLCIGARLTLILALPVATSAAQGAAAVAAEARAAYPHAEALYLDLHRNPELSFQETRTAAKLAAALRALGYDVTTGVGRTGVVAVLRNGAGPTVLLRAELDALPITENTGLPYASTVRTRNADGAEVGVMHACGHDLHMAALAGTARIMAGTRDRWRGTLVLIGQPAEETISGAKAMIGDGLLTRFPRPDFALAVHDDARMPSGVVGFRAGPILTNSDALVVRIFGRGGHGARPETTVDPIVIAARAVVALQTIVSREISPFDAAVVTVGSIHGGTKNNIIPDEVELQLTVRSFTDVIRQRLLGAIERIVKAEAVAGNAPREPTIQRSEGTRALVNDSALTARISGMLLRELGPERVRDAHPEMASEDFSELQHAGVPTLMLRIGAVAPAEYEAARKAGTQLRSLHSALFAPDLRPTLETAMLTEVLALRELMPASRPPGD